MKIAIPELALVLLIGPSGAGKSTFARRLFRPTEVLSSDACRGLVSDDENDQSATRDAFEVLHLIAAKRLAAGRLTVVDATNVQPEARKPLIELAKRYHCFAVAIVFDLPERVCHEHNRQRADRSFGSHVVRNQIQQLRRSLRGLGREGFRHVFHLTAEEQVERAEIERRPLWTRKPDLAGPFDLVGDVHGCFDELADLMTRLGWQLEEGPGGRRSARHPEGRTLVFLGDLVDRGPRVPDVLALAMGMVEDGTALAVPGNHDVKLVKALRGRQVRMAHGLAESLAQLEAETPERREEIAAFLDGLISHFVLDGGRLVVAHAGMKEEMQGRASGAVRDFALYGETTGETDEFGLPVRYPWAADYRGRAKVVYGHTPVLEPEWLNGTINLDTGCVFGGRLTALRYPELEIVSVPAARIYCEPTRPIGHVSPAADAPAVDPRTDDLLDLEDVTGKRSIETRLFGRITIKEGNAAAALESMSRFAADPRWLIYLPPTMAPPETSPLPDFLEHPNEAFAYFRKEGIREVVCEEKHMGSRVVIVLCRNEETARERFGARQGERGICLTRTGRRFFSSDTGTERELLDRLERAATAAGLWDELGTDWMLLDAELMPWSAKALELLRHQYAAVGAAGRSALARATAELERTTARLPEAEPLLAAARARQEQVGHYVAAYRRYVWPVASLADLRLAPFHLLASEGAVHAEREHLWHLEILARLAAAEPGLILATPSRLVDLENAENVESAVAWWLDLTGRGGEGMVVKPKSFVARGAKRLAQPAIKCRGREYLRIIYGPEYTTPENLARLKQRAVAAKRSLALREFALGLEGLERFVRKEPLYRVHECAFAVLALESEPIDPRL